MSTQHLEYAKNLQKSLTESGIKNIKSVEIAARGGGEDLQGGSTVQHATIHFEADNGTTKPPIKLFIKAIFESHKLVDSLLWIYDKETELYTRIMPDLIAFQKSKLKEKASTCIDMTFLPTHVCSSIIKGDKTIVLEDFKSTRPGFEASKRRAFHDIGRVKAVLEAAARIHATSYVMKKQGTDLMKTYPLIVDRFCHEESKCFMGPYIIGAFGQSVDMLNTICSAAHAGDERLAKKNLRLFPSSYIEKLDKIKPNILAICKTVLEPQEPMAVITHGDLHMYNIWFKKHEEKADDGELKYSSLIFDYQIVRYASGLVDVHHYLSQSVTPEFRKENLQKCLDLYHSEFSRVCSALGLDSSDNDYTMDAIKAEYKRAYAWGFMLATSFVWLRFVPPEDQNELFNSREDKTKRPSLDKLIAMLDKCEAWTGLQLLFDFMCEAGEFGAIDEMADFKNTE